MMRQLQIRLSTWISYLRMNRSSRELYRFFARRFKGMNTFVFTTVIKASLAGRSIEEEPFRLSPATATLLRESFEGWSQESLSELLLGLLIQKSELAQRVKNSLFNG